MTNEEKIHTVEALKFYIKVATPHKPDHHIELLENVVAELESEIIPPASIEDTFNDDTV